MKMAVSSPGGKKLKQARLSFGAAAPRAPPSPPPPSPSPAKRPKLHEAILLSDDEPQDALPADKVLNPYVKLVDVALKRHLKRKRTTTTQTKPKSKSIKKNKKSHVSSNHENDDVESKPNGNNKTADREVTDTDVGDQSDKRDDAKNQIVEIVIEDSCEATVPAIEPVAECTEPAETITHQQTDESSEEDKDNCDKENDKMETSDMEDTKENEEVECTEMVTPKRKKPNDPKQTASPGPASTPSTPISARKLTPKQAQKKIESAQRQEQREKEKKMRDLAKQLEKDEKAKLKQEREEQRQKEREEKERIKEEERRAKEEKEKAKRMIKEMEEMRKREKKEAKEEERKKRDEAIEESKRQKEIEKEEIENRKKKTSMAFVSFFVPKEKSAKPKDVAENQSMDDSNHNYLSNFTIKSDMRLAPIVRHTLTEKYKNLLDKFVQHQKSGDDSLYLSNLKSTPCKRSGKTWPLEELKNDLIIIEDDLPSVDDSKEDNQVISDPNHRKMMKPKLLSFTENRRPPYWGTWRRKTSMINGRRPFAMDKTYLDYTCDSDEEWEEEEPGESVESVAGSDDDDDENEYDVDNDFMVPHGYLSDEEALGDDDNALSPETQKAKLKFLEHEFEDEMKKTTKIKKPRLIGIFWQNSNGDKPELCPDTIWDFLAEKKILSSELEISIQSNNDKENEIESSNKNVSRSSRKISDDMIPSLIRLIHGNTNNRGFLIKEFQMFLARSPNTDADGTPAANKDVSKVSIAKKIKELSTWMPCPEDGLMCTKMCWFVEKDVREKHNVHDLTLPNQWTYVLVPKRRSDIPKKEKCKSPPTKTNAEIKNNANELSGAKKDGKFNITKFTKKMTEDDRKSQFVPPNPQDTKTVTEPNGTSQPEIKRVSLLFSGPRGKSIPDNIAKISETNPDNNQENQCNVQKPTLKTDNVEAKKRVPLLASGPRGKDLLKPVKTNLLTQFIKNASVKYNNSSESDSKTEANDLIVLSD